MMKSFLMTVLSAGVLLVSGVAVGADEKKMNVLFIAVDDLRPDLGAYGNQEVKSPNIDRLAKDGVVFNRAYCQFPLCNPSRASLLAGKRPETLGIMDLKTNLRQTHPDLVTLPQLFKKNGYHSLSIGKIFHITNGNFHDFESFSELPFPLPKNVTSGTTVEAAQKNILKAASEGKAGNKPGEKGRPWNNPDVADDGLADGRTARKAVEKLRENKDRPFFMAVGFHKPHMPFTAPKKYWDLYDPALVELAMNQYDPKGAPEWASNQASELRRYKGVNKEGPIAAKLQRELRHGYLACISYVDAQVGLLLDELDSLGLRENTIVILWGDHGYQLGEHATWNKRTTWEITSRVPMIISVPGGKDNGKRTDALVEFVDIYPSLAELCGLTPPADLEGTSFVPLVENTERPWKTAAFTTYTENKDDVGRVTARAMRTDQYRVIEWEIKGQAERVYELYDQKADPQGNVNLANDTDKEKLMEELAAQLAKGWKGNVPPAAE